MPKNPDNISRAEAFALRYSLREVEKKIVRLQTRRDVLAVQIQRLAGLKRPCYGFGSTNRVPESRLKVLRERGLI